MMLLVTLPKNGKLAPTRSAATIASASSINPISVSDPIHPLILCNASMCVLPIRQEAQPIRTLRTQVATICVITVAQKGSFSSRTRKVQRLRAIRLAFTGISTGTALGDKYGVIRENRFGAETESLAVVPKLGVSANNIRRRDAAPS